MNKLICLIIVLCMPVTVMAAGGGHNEHIVAAPINMDDKVSLQRGAQIFVNNCLGCHSAQYMRYERVSEDLEIPSDIMMANLMFTTDRIGEVMHSAIPKDLSKKWFGTVPPDLTLIARVRGADWVYSYLTNFYPDESRPWNVNNHVFPDVGMPHVLSRMEEELGEKAFKSSMADLTNYMVYMAEPARADRERIGVYVLIFLAILFIPVYFLNREYWKDIH
ncbi:cytochrome c1 [Ketobacter sp. MCCC 1A13808]|uniref:cytochrome c1 n=1 Tax=Ketobacter sp. MCCC 1A13808 TaxID=2602738 RepID=UPI000F1D0461|nr:cytochrome c1 [Ketobacter sp. MCCC 1A13808]MVF11220.1 cytochrome c1 [Ketobacter sp. MCCC 1A13808]RLP53647.1 MAG: cytochrome c1 [Ketobacter sp.]